MALAATSVVVLSPMDSAFIIAAVSAPSSHLAGNMGRGMSTRAVAGGHQVEILAQDPSHAAKLASELGASATALEAGTPLGGEVVVFAVYYPGIKDAVRQYADQLAGKVVVDITNPLDT